MSDILTKIKSTADILGGDVFFANAEGLDPENLNSPELLPNGMYLRLEGSDGSRAYISAYEIDRSISTIINLSKDKANQADVDALQALLESKASDTDIELLRSDLEGVATKTEVEAVSASLTGKADKTELVAIEETIATKAAAEDIDELLDTIGTVANDVAAINTSLEDKAAKTDITKLQTDIKALQDALDSMTDENTITMIQNQIEYLNNELNKKINADALTSINNSILAVNDGVEVVATRLENVESTITGKASKTYVQDQITRLTGEDGAVTLAINNAVSTKADKADVLVKANKEELDKLTAKVTGINTTVNRLSLIESNYQELSNNIAGKADKRTTDAAIAALTSNISNKADKAEILNSISLINTKIRSIEDVHDEDITALNEAILDVEGNVNSVISGFNSTLNSATRTINDHTSKIQKLESKDTEFANSLKNEWVKVMTPEAYKSLRPIGSNSINAKKANTVYMLVRYNKPIAVYIGDILIAQAEQKGSQGFAYTFPITF